MRSAASGGAQTPVNQIDLPLTEVIQKVPDRLKSFVAKIPTADDVATFSASLLMPQLAKGSVKITFAELVEASPPGIFSSSMGGDDELIELPLALVISRLGTGSFQRKPAKQAASVKPQDFFGAGRKAIAPAAPVLTPPASAPTPTAGFAPKFPDGPVEPAGRAPTAAPTFSPAPPTAPAPETKATEAAPESPPDKAAISLAGILKTLPAELADCLKGEAPPDATVELSAAALLPQLAKGKVTVTFAELLEATPPGLFVNTAGHEPTLVPLPLAEVLAKVGPGAFKRKAPARQLAPATDQKFFGGLAKPIDQEPAEPAVNPADEDTVISSHTTFQRAPAVESTLPAQPVSPPSSSPGPPPTADATPGVAGMEPAGHKFEPQPIAPDSPTPASAKESDGAAEVPVLLTDLTAKFPDGLKAEITKLPADSVIVFPAEALGLAMKSAKIRFTWTQLRRWMLPRNTQASTVWEGTQVEIPLKAVVGPFMAAMRGQPPKIKLPAGSPAAEAGPAAPAPAPAAPYQPEPFVPRKSKDEAAPDATATARSAPSDSALGELLEQPGKQTWTPVEIVQQVGRLDGVGGAMLSLAEGQIAAAAIAVNVKSDLIAFRIPRLLSQVSEHVEQMQLESTPFVSFSSAGVSWIAFKLGNIFFTVHGRKGENLPVTRLESIAAEVARRK